MRAHDQAASAGEAQVAPQPASPRSRLHSRIAVVTNTTVGGVLGTAFGTFGSCPLWLLGGLVLGALLGLANEALFHRSRRLARWYKLRTVILVLAESLLGLYVVVPAVGAYETTRRTTSVTRI